MTAEDVMNLKKSVEQSSKYSFMKQQCENRLSAANYLNKKLGNGNKWLEALAACSGYVSGSVSLDFFVPGSMTLSSDCDVYFSKQSDINLFVQYGMELNIKWLDNADMVKMQLANGKTKVRMSADEFRKIHNSGRLYEVIGDEFRPKYSRIFRNWDGHVELEFSDKHMSIKRVYDHGWYGTQGILDMKYGEMQRNNITVPVQLILQADRTGTPFASIFKFHSTCVQSFIGPYAACHLYGKEAAKKVSHCWIDNVKKYVPDMHFPSRPKPSPLGNIGHLAPEWKKYEDRGFSYFSLAVYVGYQNRRIGDDQCTMLEYPGPFGIETWSAKNYQEEVKSVEWKHYNNKRPILHYCGVVGVRRRKLPNDFMGIIQPLTT